MGIQGLATYVSKHKDYKYQDHIDLLDWAKQKGFAEVGLVVDGYSLMYKIAEKLEWDFLNGGQYEKLHNAAQEYFQSLLVLGVKLVVVFDGMLQDSKLSAFHHRRNDDIEHILRAVQQIKDTGELSVKSTKFIMPVLSGTIFKAAISELGINVVCTLNEADRHIAHLASALNPESKNVFWVVIAQDSDFLIYQTTGYVPLDSLTVSTSSLICDLYQAEHIAKAIGIPVQKLGLMAALASNDFLTSKDLADFHNRIVPRGQKLHSGVIIDEVIYNIKKNKIETEDTQKLAEYVFKDKSRTDREKYIPILKEAIANYSLTQGSYVAYEREFKRWAADTRAITWRDTKIELPDYTKDYINGVMMSEVASVMYGRQWAFCLPFEDLKKCNAVLLLQSFRKTLYNWIFYDNPRAESITENLCWELKYFDMKVPVSRKDAKIYMRDFKDIFGCTEEVKFSVMYQVMGFPTSALVNQLDIDFNKWLVCSLRIIVTIAREKKKANKDSTFLFEYEIDAVILSMLLKNPALSVSDLPPLFGNTTDTTQHADKDQYVESKEKENDKQNENDKTRGEKVKLSIYSINLGCLFQLATMHFRFFNEVMGTMIKGYLDFIRCIDGTHFSNLYHKLYHNRNKEWDSVDEYLEQAIGHQNEEIKRTFLQVKASLVEGFRGDDIFAKQVLFSGESKTQNVSENVCEPASKKLKT